MELANRNTGAYLAVILAAMAITSCRTAGSGAGPPIVQPGAPGEPSRIVTAEKAADHSKVPFTPADVRFIQGMIHHHAQALDMTGLIASRTGSEAMRRLGQRIEVSQADEIKMMQRWLETRGQQVPDAHARHAPGASLMPGMLTEAEMSQLAAAKGVEFDRLFLRFMIKHHGGALTMVKELFSTAGAAQEGEIFGFASDVDADQRMEINRMEAMLRESGT